MSLDDFLRPRLASRRAEFRYRQRQSTQTAAGPRVRLNGRELVCFCSNDYLGMANHPQVKQAMQQATEDYGVGSGASHLVTGHSEQHHLLEQELAAFTGRDRALLFSTGYMANMGVIAALVGRGDQLFEDRLNHASLLDGGMLSGARMQRFAHNDLNDLRKRLAAVTSGHTLIAVDGVFSMDGDLAPLPELASVAAEHDAWLMVDDAHGLGCLGAQGGGSCEYFQLSQQQVPILMGTLGKAFGSFGAFIAGSEALIESLIQFARTYIYTTAIPPAVAAATRASLALIQREPLLRRNLQERITQFRLGAERLNLPVSPSISPIQPIVLGDEQRALRWSERLLQHDCWVSAIRPPTVAKGTARLRVTLSAAHTTADVEQLLAGLAVCSQVEV